MSEVEIPDFDLSGEGLDFTSDEELDNAVVKDSSGGARFQPGENSATITAPVYHVKDGTMKNKNDPTWIMVKIPLVGDGGESKDQYLLVPTKKLGFNTASGKVTTLLYTKFVEFMASIGVNINRANAIKAAHTFFGDPSFKKLEGKTLKFNYGFNAKYHLERSQDGIFTCVDKDGVPVTDADGDVIAAPDKDNLAASLAVVGVKSYQEYPEILSFIPAEAKKAKAKKVEEVKEESEDEWGF